jgi:hypothetical protein
MVKPERITAEALLELIQRNAVCVQRAFVFLVMLDAVHAGDGLGIERILRLGSEEDKAFRRCGDIPAARPLGSGRFREDE